MGIQKHEFYEGAALHRLVQAGGITSIFFEAPFFVINERIRLYLKYSTKVRSPWGFTFTPEEQKALWSIGDAAHAVFGLVCAADGVAALRCEDYMSIAPERSTSVHIACYRKHRQRFQINGPEGAMLRKVAPSEWERLVIDWNTTFT